MLTLVTIVIFGIMFALFATQNTGSASIQVGSYFWNLPIYLLVLGALLIGLFISWIFSTLDSVSSWLSIQGRDSKIKDKEAHISRLENKIRELEMNNVKLSERVGNKYSPSSQEVVVEDKHENAPHRSILGRIKHSLSF